jgi:ABC-type transport system involved in multi-copper enzyme maturation permease subunit
MDAFAMGYVRMLFILQAVPAFFLAVIVVPPLISADLTHGALPLYLARPLSRWSYLGGKALVPALLLSPPTWIAGMGVFGVKAILAGGSWWIDNLRLASGFLIGHTVWIAVITLVTLAISTFVRYAWAARGALFALFFVLGGFSAAVNLVTRSRWGSLMSIVYDIRTVVADLFGVRPPDSLPPVACWLALAAAASLSLAILAQTLRAHQEVS